MKKCFKCGAEKSSELFGTNTNTKDGLQGWCKECMAAYHKEWRPKYSKTVERKLCYQCKLVLPPESFSKNSRAADGLQTMCKHCAKAYHDQPEVRKKNNDRLNQKWQSGEVRDARYQKLFGITLEEYNRKFTEQGGVCQICSKPQDGQTKNLAVDHCHATGKVRGLLCNNCNRALGLFEDSTALVEKAAAYLAVYENQTTLGEPNG